MFVGTQCTHIHVSCLDCITRVTPARARTPDARDTRARTRVSTYRARNAHACTYASVTRVMRARMLMYIGRIWSRTVAHDALGPRARACGPRDAQRARTHVSRALRTYARQLAVDGNERRRRRRQKFIPAEYAGAAAKAATTCALCHLEARVQSEPHPSSPDST